MMSDFFVESSSSTPIRAFPAPETKSGDISKSYLGVSQFGKTLYVFWDIKLAHGAFVESTAIVGRCMAVRSFTQLHLNIWLP